jgi:hypothetical protein
MAPRCAPNGRKAVEETIEVSYVDPRDAVAPRSSWKLTEVLCNTGHGGWSMADGLWQGRACLAMRWNGDDFSASSGSPLATGRPTWTILPDILAAGMRSEAMKLAAALSRVRSQSEVIDGGMLLLKIELNEHALAGLNDQCLHFPIPGMGGLHAGAPSLGSTYALGGPRKSLSYFRAPWSPAEDWRGVVIDGYWEAMADAQALDETKRLPLARLFEDRVACSVAMALMQCEAAVASNDEARGQPVVRRKRSASS